MNGGQSIILRVLLFLLALASLAAATTLQAIGEMATPAWAGFTAALGAFVGVHVAPPGRQHHAPAVIVPPTTTPPPPS